MRYNRRKCDVAFLWHTSISKDLHAALYLNQVTGTDIHYKKQELENHFIPTFLCSEFVLKLIYQGRLKQVLCMGLNDSNRTY